MDIIVTAKSLTSTSGTVAIGDKIFECVLGKSGLIDTADKREGDMKTPIGEFPLRKVFYRSDRVEKPETIMEINDLTSDIAWCDDPEHKDYNKQITTDHPTVEEGWVRREHLFEYIIVIGHNDDPPIPGHGSCIFIHLARPEFTPTAGCVGLKREDMLELLKLCTANSIIKISVNED